MAKKIKSKKTSKAKKASKPKKTASKPKKSSSKKKVAKKAAKKKTTVKKPAPKKPAKKKVEAKKTAPKKVASKKEKTKKSASVVAEIPARPAIPAFLKKRPMPVIEKIKRARAVKLSPKFIEDQKLHLVELRDHLLDQMQGVAHDSLRAPSEGSGGSAFGMHQADAGSDAYEKDFALSLLSQEQDALYEIEEALKRLENGTYGICEMSGNSIPAERLKAIPFARYTVECQSRFEKEHRGQKRWDTVPQFMDSTDNFFEEEEEADDDDKKKD